MSARTLLIHFCLAALTVSVTFALPIELDPQAVRLALARPTSQQTPHPGS